MVPALALAMWFSASAEAAVVWSEVQWFTWNAAINPGASVGSVGLQQVSVTVAGTHASNAGSSTSKFDSALNGTYAMTTPGLGLGSPKAGTIVTYTLNLASLTIPSSSLVVGIANLDATNSRGSLTVSGVDDLNQVSNVNTWTTEAQFKAQAGIPSAQSLVVRTVQGNNMRLGTAQGPDNTSWGDSRGIFFTGLDPDLKTISFAHQYNHPNATVSDNIGLYVGIIPEPSACILLSGGALVVLRRGRRDQPAHATAG
jgi:hypothetical protein